MKSFSCFSLRSIALFIASVDIVCAIATIIFCSFYLYEDFIQVSQLQEGIQVQNPLAYYIAAVVDYVTIHNFSNAFYMILCVTLWIKSLINLVVASILIDGTRKQRLICLAPWLINNIISMLLEIGIFIFIEIKIDGIDISMDRRVARCILFGIFLVINALFTFGIFAHYNVIKVASNENRALQESIVEAAGLFQHVKV